MPKTLIDRDYGSQSVPHAIRELRESSFDYHETLGTPVIFKHRWNLVDLREGRAQRCPLHDDIYDSDLSWDHICFGTGMVGGYADGQIVYVSIQDAPTDVIRVTPQGLLSMDTQPGMSAPWIPEMGDDDMIILADFNPMTWEILDLHERFILGQVRPVTMRGPEFRPKVATGRPYRVNQTAQIHKLPWGHPFYDVPIVFDPRTVPPDTTPDFPYGPLPPGFTYSEYEIPIRVRGHEEFTSTSAEYDIRIPVYEQPGDSYTQDIKVIGGVKGSHFHW